MTLAQLAARARVRWTRAADPDAPGAVTIAVVNVGPVAAIHRLALTSVTIEHPAGPQAPTRLRLLAAPADERVLPVDWEALCLELDYLLALGLPDDTRVRVTATAGVGDRRREDVALLAVTEQPDAALVCTRDRRNLDAPWPRCDHGPSNPGQGVSERTPAFSGLLETGPSPTAPAAPADVCPREHGEPAPERAGDATALDITAELTIAHALWSAVDSESSFQRALTRLDCLLADLCPRHPAAQPATRLDLPAGRHVNLAAVTRLLARARQLAATPEPDRVRLQEQLNLIRACFADGRAQRFETW